MAETKTKKKTAKKAVKKTVKEPERKKAENIEELVIEIAKKEKSPAKIGQILKEKHNIINTKALGKKISQILKENSIEYFDDLTIVNQKIKKLEEHFAKNKQDKRSKRELVKFIGLRRKLEKYNKKNKNL
jgi:ribosomal protein S15